MKMFIASLASVTPYCQSRHYAREVPRLSKEGPDAYEDRTWRYKTHINEDGQIIIPADSLQFCVRDGAAYLGEKIPGRGSEKWTKHFASGVIISDPIVLPERRETVGGQWVHCHANGRRGGGTRVWRCFPVIPRWKGDITIVALDDLITDEILRRVLFHAGSFVGLGQNRPQNGGSRGRFKIEAMIQAENPVELAEAA